MNPMLEVHASAGRIGNRRIDPVFLASGAQKCGFLATLGAMDDLDRRLIDCLLEDGRASYAAIGQRIGLSAPAVKRRMDRLVDDGVIAGFTAVLDPHLVGWATEAYVEVHCKGTISPDELRAAFHRVPEVHAAATVSGQADAILHIVAKDVRDLERALERIRVETGTVDHTETAIVLSRLIDRHGPRQTEIAPPT
jgi:DNA-binding Lrp family transcriptional regulator